MTSIKQEIYNDEELPPPEVQEGRSRAFWVFSVLGLVVVAAGIAGVTYAAVPSLKPASSEAAVGTNVETSAGEPTGSPIAIRATLAPTFEATSSSGTGDCNSGQKLVEFFIQLDQDSNHETGWSLHCSEGEVWNVPVGILEETKENRSGNNQIMQSTCVDDTETCEFIVYDSYGDGLMEGNGYFYLRYGAATVATYAMSEGEFDELRYCFGPNCHEELDPIQDEQLDPIETTDECARLYLGIGFDANPEELSYQVQCNGEVVLQGPWGDNLPFSIFEEETCVPLNSCCKFNVTDSGGDGLTSIQGVGGDYGWIYVEYGMEKVYGYTGDDDGAFSNAEAAFGDGCEGGA
ncbi:unnamed protein product [Cylindrotheca closterium]|uniref:Uncharacterized protein n=1 Tax=Cylindrotheca closterium TaxID=2856 RepID=A0AAD2FQZ1_9STRA|nr:unnamed protein product [Cylindrotheca closterium]